MKFTYIWDILICKRNMAANRVTSFPGSLSSAFLVVGRKALVAAGHVTTQNLGGKKSVGREG